MRPNPQRYFLQLVSFRQPIMNTHRSPVQQFTKLPRSSAAERALRFSLPFAVLIAVWYVAVAVSHAPLAIFPQVTDVLRALERMARSGDLLSGLLASLGRIASGVALAVCTAIPFGLLMGSSKSVSDLLAPLMRFFVAISGIAWLPLATLWLGYGYSVGLFIIWNAVFFPITYHTMLGVRSINPNIRRAALTLGTGKVQLYYEVLLPGALPMIVTGLRIGVGFGWRSLIVAEMIAANQGLAYSLFLAQQNYDTAEVVAIMIIIGALWLLTDKLILERIEKVTIQRWGMRKAAA
ncbi:MAG: ABC transporter permease [Rhizobiaceae bacterium]|nr:ABC transporter permease [Rhizobiaceae bacterium]